MNIKTITCHDVYNYGASLQAFALQKFLEQSGHNVEIIDYRPSYISFQYKFSWFVHPDSPVKKYTDKSVILHFMYCFKRYLWYIPTISRKLSFDHFTKKYLKTTKKYISIKDLQQDVPDADVYIVGSDQVWNSVTMLNGKDPSFFLQFAPSGKKRLSYAASFGSNNVDKEMRSQITSWLKTFNSISVRESNGVNLLSELGCIGHHVCDPVFLLSCKEWKQYLQIESGGDKYVLIYNLTSRNENLIRDALYVAKAKNLRLYSVSPFRIKEADKNFNNVGPEQFVKLIFNAEYVFTNSFHATAFSIIGQRQFFTYNYHSKGNSSRMHSVLNEMQLLDRFNISSIESSMNSDIDYEKKCNLIEASTQRGKMWLTENL